MSSQPTISQNVTQQTDRGEQFFPILREQLPLCWPLVEQYLRTKRGGVHDLYELPELYAELLANSSMHLWVGWHNGEIEGIVVLQFVSTSKSCTCWIQNVHCDKIHVYKKFWAKLEDWAAICGAKEILFTGSKAWERLLRSQGYKVPSALLQKTINVRWRH